MSRISIRISQDEESKINEIEKKTNETVSHIVRQFILSGKPLFTCEQHRQEKAAAFRHIAKTGNNLNQIAHQLNAAYLMGELDREHIAFYLNVLHNIAIQLNLMNERIKQW